MARTTEKVNSTDHGNRNPRSGKRGVNHEDRRASQVVSKRNPCDMLKKTTIQPAIQLKAHKRIGTWNVRSLYQQEKAYNLIQEM